MPTSLPLDRREKPRLRPSLFVVWAIALFTATIAIEWLDPAPTDVAAAWVVSP